MKTVQAKGWKRILSIEYKGHWDALRMLNRKRPLSYRARLVVGEEGGKRGILRPSLFPLLPPCDPCYTNPLQATLSLRPIHSTVFTPSFDHHRSSQCLTYNSKFNFVWIALMTVRNMVKKIYQQMQSKVWWHRKRWSWEFSPGATVLRAAAASFLQTPLKLLNCGGRPVCLDGEIRRGSRAIFTFPILDF